MEKNFPRKKKTKHKKTHVMEAVNPCNEKEECFPSQGNVTRGQAVVRSPARRAPPAHTSYGPFFWLSSPRTSTQPAVWSPRVTTPARPWEAQLQTLPLCHQPVPASFPTAGDFSGCCRGGRVRREDGWPRGMKLDALSGSLFLARSSSPSRSNQNYWKHLCP